MSAFATYGSDAAVFHAQAGGETVVLHVAGAAAGTAGDVTLEGVIVLRGGQMGRLAPRRESDMGAGGRVEFALEVQIPKALYPNAAGVKGAGTPAEQADVVKVAAKDGDTVLSSRRVSRVLGESGGMWHLGLD